MLSVELIHKILIESDPEGLVKMGAPIDEYSSEAEKIYKRIIFEDRLDIIDYTSAVVFVFAEAFSCWSNEDGSFGYSFGYLNKWRIDKFKVIGKLIFEKSYEI